MPKVRKNKSKDNVVPFNKPKVDKVAEEKHELRQSEQDRLNAVIKEKCSEILEIIDLSQIEKQWGLYAFLFHCKQITAFDLHPSEYVRLNDTTNKEIIKNQREYLEESFPEFVRDDANTEENTKKVLH